MTGERENINHINIEDMTVEMILERINQYLDLENGLYESGTSTSTEFRLRTMPLLMLREYIQETLINEAYVESYKKYLDRIKKQ